MNPKVKKVRKILVAVIILTVVAGFTSCEKFGIMPIPFDPLTTWHFQADIQPIFSANCTVCHNGTRSPDLRDGKSYNALTKGVVKYAVASDVSSRLYLKLESGHPTSSFSVTNDKLKILNWIKQGALNN